MRKRLTVFRLPEDQDIEKLRITGSQYLVAELELSEANNIDKAEGLLDNLGYRLSCRWQGLEWKIAPQVWKGNSYLRLYIMVKVA